MYSISPSLDMSSCRRESCNSACCSLRPLVLAGRLGVVRGSVGAARRPRRIALGQEGALPLRARSLRLLEVLEDDVEVLDELLMLCDVRVRPSSSLLVTDCAGRLTASEHSFAVRPMLSLCLLSFARSSLVSFPVPSESTARLNDDTLVVIWKMSP